MMVSIFTAQILVGQISLPLWCRFCPSLSKLTLVRCGQRNGKNLPALKSQRLSPQLLGESFDSFL